MPKKLSLTGKTDQELSKLLEETRETLRSERFAAAGARAKNPSHAKILRAVIARTLTEKRARSTSSRQAATLAT